MTRSLLDLRHYRAAGLLRLLFGMLIPLLIVGVLGEDVLERQRFAFETPLMLSLHARSTAALDQLAVLLATVGGVKVIAPLSALIAYVLYRRSFIAPAPNCGPESCRRAAGRFPAATACIAPLS